MSISAPASQLKLEWDLSEEESSSSALDADEIQLRKDLAEAFIQSPNHWEKDEQGKPVKPYWLDQAITLHEGKMRFPFRAAVLTAWLCTPKKYRYPKTQSELADLLGLSSDRQFTIWMAKNSQIKAVVHTAWKEKALDHLNDSMEAMFEVAATPDYKGKGDRELHFKVTEILSDKVILDNSGNVDLSKISFEEKLRLLGAQNREELLALVKKYKGDGEEESDTEEDGNASSDSA